jgi:glycosyltransferase involved in cell wall biosynthesis
LSELRAQLGLPDGFLIGCVANLRPIKGIDVLLRAVGGSDQLRDSCRVVLIGAGPEESALRALAAEQGIGDRVFFLGSRPDIPELLRGLDMAVLASHAESSPNSVLEYMATGLPVVGTSAGGIPELLLPNRAGLVVPPGRPEELGEAIESLLQSPELRAACGREARSRAETEHAPSHILARWTETLEQFSQASR